MSLNQKSISITFNEKLKRMTLSGILLSLSLLLPFLTGGIPNFGKMLLPMHLPVLLCGFCCGPWYGMLIGMTAPLLRFLLFGLPPILPTGLCMSAELAGYGLFSGLLWSRMKRKSMLMLFVVLISAMLLGRLLWAMTCFVVYPVLCGKEFTFALFFAGAFLEAWPGIILQILLIPLLMRALSKIHVVSLEGRSL